MTFPTPTCTIIPAAPIANTTTVIGQLISHFGSSTKFTIDHSTATSLCLSCNAEGWQINFRVYNATWAYIAIDPQGLITDSSNPSASASSEWSGEVIYSGQTAFKTQTGPTVKSAILELNDAIIWIQYDPTTAFAANAFIAGRIMAPLHASDVARGLSGLGWIGSEPFYQTSTAIQAWFSLWSNATPTYTSQFVVFQEGLTTAEWEVRHQVDWDASLTEADCTIGGVVSPAPLVLYQHYRGRPVGVLKYVYQWWISDTCFTRITNGGVTYLHLWNTVDPAGMLIPWDNSTIP